LNIRRAALVAVPLIAAVTAGVAVASSGRGVNSSKFTGTIKLMTIGPINAQGFSLPSIPVGAQVAVNEINAAGGAGGKKLVLMQCNDNNDPNTGAACGATAVKSKVAAVVGGLSTVSAQIVPLLQRAHIPWVGVTPVGDFKTSILYLTGPTGPVGYIGAGEALVKQGCKKTAIISDDTPPALASDAFMKVGIQFLKGGFAGQFTAPQNAPDWAPTVAAAQAAGADCVGLGTGPPESGAVIAAIRQTGKQMKIAGLSGGIPQPVIAQLGAPADGVLATSAFLPPTSSVGSVQKLKKAAARINPTAPYDDFLPAGYAAVKLVAFAAKNLKTVNGVTLANALNKVKNFSTGVGPVYNLTKPNPNPAFARIFWTKAFVWVARGGQFYLSTAVNAGPALASMK
jgi:ABC-type branched-subunit amino acid transport system substrate-binding protein